MLAPESAALEVVAREVGVGAGTLGRWLEDAQSRPARGRAWTAGARFDAVITTAAMNEAGKSAWCREYGVYPADLDKWRTSCTTALANPEDMRASPQATRADRKRIKELERELLRKDRALAETAALLVLSKKVAAINNQGRGRMIGLEDRQALAQDIEAAHSAGARLQPACEVAGIDARTLQRWKGQQGLTAGDGRP